MINAFLIDMAGRLVLIDSGAGNLYGTEGGGLKQAIVAAGYTPEQVTDVFVTHLHEDHVGGLVLDGQPVFPHATIHIPRKDADFWLDDRNRAGVDDLLKPFFPAVQGVLAPYRRAGRVSPFEEGAALLPGAGQSRPPESDGSTYTWTGAATLTVDVKPWGGGYVRSDPYLIDCPMACIRAFEPNREVKLTAYMTPGHTFKAWEGACAGQGNPCTIKVSGAMDVTAVLEGQFVPPTPPKPPAPPGPPVALNPSLTVTTNGLTATLTGTGYNPSSSISLDFSVRRRSIAYSRRYRLTGQSASDLLSLCHSQARNASLESR